MALQLYSLEDHICKKCQCRIMKLEDPKSTKKFKYICPNCGAYSHSTNTEKICYCGSDEREHSDEEKFFPYRCMPFSVLKEKPELKQAFTFGFFKNKEIGIVQIDDYESILKTGKPVDYSHLSSSSNGTDYNPSSE